MKEINEYLRENARYDSIVKPTEEEKRIARRARTNLTAMGKLQVNCLIKQANALRESQMKLYCP